MMAELHPDTVSGDTLNHSEGQKLGRELAAMQAAASDSAADPSEKAAASDEAASDEVAAARAKVEAASIEQSADTESTKEQKLALAETWLSARSMQSSKEAEAVPAAIASEVAVVAQRQMEVLEDGDLIDDDFYALQKIRNEAAETAEELDFELVQKSGSDWAFRVGLDAMHSKFKQVSRQALNDFLGDDGGSENRALRIRNIVADHAPDLLTEDLKTIMDPSQPVWRASSAHARILLRNQSAKNISAMRVDQVPISAPEDEQMKQLSQMSDEELALYARPEYEQTVKERGYALYSELNQGAREGLLTQRLYEAVVKSGDPASKDLASEHNRALEHDPIMHQGDLVHATDSLEILKSILSDGLRCGEAITSNNSDVIKQPFTVSFLEVDKATPDHESAVEAFKQLKNSSYGEINLVLDSDASSMKAGALHQRQVFAGKPSTEIKRIIIRDEIAKPDTADKVIQIIVEHGMFIPVYSGATGEPLLTSQQFDQLSAA